ncbi:carboxymuconolactone decarboxylase family protein [Nocardia sp. CDC159]|uniref:Carboxymuconolactone decarboxylase family protein n=1 Tax=Nocardia pulmonis TaxID=2951408 RepID=A0A9X2E982_9NOCA|nr:MULTISPECIES: carboxymuconolactone decarboxylase family protein [Nocardia]MCM6774106.1 carboxymuconolactone decarboxylase family protein [Nocardia pulmonis]MCM6786993.1 carboxymuconolactone decarboxylase family protein [Nocardia sp. CDC159]
MARIDLLDPATMTQREQQLYNLFPINLTRAMLVADPDITEAFLRQGNALQQSALNPVLRELTILRIAALTGCDYERFHHAPRARQVGASDQEIAAATTGDLSALDPIQAALLRYAEECVTKWKASAETFEAARAELGDSGIAIATMLIGHYVLNAIFAESLELDIDPELADWSIADRQDPSPPNEAASAS